MLSQTLDLPPVPAIPRELRFSMTIKVRNTGLKRDLERIITQKKTYTLCDDPHEASVVISDDRTMLEEVTGRHVIKVLVVQDQSEKTSYKETSHFLVRTATEVLKHFSL